MSGFLITGGAGFIGSHLADALLNAGHHVRILDDFSTGRLTNLDRRCEVLQGDVGDTELLGRAFDGAAGCFHLAAIASVARANEDWPGTHRVNQAATVAVLDASRKTRSATGGNGQSIPVVYASSAAIYGNAAGVCSETDTPSPRTAYGVDKLGSELHARIGHLVHNVPSMGLRFFNVYGPRQDPASPYSGVISIFARAVGAGLPLTLHGNGRQTRDFVYVTDVVRHLINGMTVLKNQGGCHVLNVCTGRETSLLDLIQILSELAGQRSAVMLGPARAGDIVRSVGSPSQTTQLLRLRAETSLREGLRTTMTSLAPLSSLVQA